MLAHDGPLAERKSIRTGSSIALAPAPMSTQLTALILVAGVLWCSNCWVYASGLWDQSISEKYSWAVLKAWSETIAAGMLHAPQCRSTNTTIHVLM